MVVNDNAGYLDKRCVLESIASRLAPTVSGAGRITGGRHKNCGSEPARDETGTFNIDVAR
ncbi:hypothetical protein DKY63_07120 [Pseudomonas putida]|uniref:Uncharacterized protein n=1 Tax=Pseudomonas putida TaxID=303 RepID=A0A2Z4RF92_PSEPU|nr:hypothetical protein DKY63_07120 [Pseudomonas putida]